MEKTLTKLHDLYTELPKWIDLNNVISVEEIEITNTNAIVVKGTTIGVGSSGCMINVKEHITEVLAHVEGRDPNPAKVLFKGNK